MIEKKHLRKYTYAELCPRVYMEDFDEQTFMKIAQRLNITQQLNHHPSEQFVNANELIGYIKTIVEKEKITRVDYLKERLIEELNREIEK